MSDSFVNLHVHSEYSYLDAVGHPFQFVQRAKALGQSAIAVTDHGNVSAHKRWYDSCKKEKIKPILGVEAYVCEDASKKEREMFHITLLAKNLVGYRNLLKIVTESWQNGFYYKPRTDFNILKQFSEGIVATSGCPGGKIGKGVTGKGWSESQVVAEMKRQAAIFKDYYVELSPWQYPEGVSLAGVIYKAAVKEGLPLILTTDAHYPCEKDAFIQDVMLCIQNAAKFEDPGRMKFYQQDYCLWSGDDIVRKWFKIHGNKLPGRDEMILNTRKIADEVDFEFPNAVPLAFKYDGDKAELLWKLCQEGMVERKLDHNESYKSRLKYEFDLMVAKNFVDYFLVVQDLVVWAKHQKILVGPARGSSCGSLMCYLLHITEIDPLKHGLLVERFVSPERTDLPDVDLDFDSERRNDVKDYLEKLYGSGNVANLATFATFKGKLCLQDIGRVFSIPVEVTDEVKRLIVSRSSADSRAGFTVEDTFTNFEQAAEHLKKYPQLGLAKDLEGQIRQLGVHAAGVVISNEPIDNFASIYKTKTGDRVISMDYYDAVSVGLLKIDLLGLTVLTAMKRIIAMIENNHGVKIVFEDLALDDKPTYDNFCKAALEGVFQFEGQSTRQVCRQVKPDSFDMLVAVNALSRPGPLHSNGTTHFINRRFGKEEIEKVHPIYDDVTKDTYGIAVYQEQVMRIVKDVGQFSWAETGSVRQAMAKKKGDEYFQKMREKFVAGAGNQGIDEKSAIKMWESVATFGSWAFNRAHAVAYSVMAYQIMWLKTHYPNEFYAGVMSCEPDADKRKRMIREYVNMVAKPLPVCINKSDKTFTCDKDGLRLGFDAVVGLPEKIVDKIIAKRPYKSYIDFERCQILEKYSKILLEIGAFRDLDFKHVSRQVSMLDDDSVTNIGFDYCNPTEETLLKYCPLAASSKLFDEARAWLETQTKDKVWKVTGLDSITDWEEVLLVGSTNPATRFNLKNKMEEATSRGGTFKGKEGEDDYTKEDYNFLNFDLEDGTETVIIRISYKQYPKYKDLLWNISPTDILAVRGKVNGEMRMVFAFDVVNLSEMRRRAEKGLAPDEKHKKFLAGSQFAKTFSKNRKKAQSYAP